MLTYRKIVVSLSDCGLPLPSNRRQLTVVKWKAYCTPTVPSRCDENFASRNDRVPGTEYFNPVWCLSSVFADMLGMALATTAGRKHSRMADVT
jgi:hypothetical protein